MKTGRRQQAVVWGILPLLLWMLIGGAFALQSGSVLASSLGTLGTLGTHHVCACLVCKGGKMACCCTPTASDTLSASCDAAQEKSTGVALAPSLLPPSVGSILPPIVIPFRLITPGQTEIPSSRNPTPLLTPPKRLS